MMLGSDYPNTSEPSAPGFWSSNVATRHENVNSDDIPHLTHPSQHSHRSFARALEDHSANYRIADMTGVNYATGEDYAAEDLASEHAGYHIGDGIAGTSIAARMEQVPNGAYPSTDPLDDHPLFDIPNTGDAAEPYGNQPYDQVMEDGTTGTSSSLPGGNASTTHGGSLAADPVTQPLSPAATTEMLLKMIGIGPSFAYDCILPGCPDKTYNVAEQCAHLLDHFLDGRCPGCLYLPLSGALCEGIKWVSSANWQYEMEEHLSSPEAIDCVRYILATNDGSSDPINRAVALGGINTAAPVAMEGDAD